MERFIKRMAVIIYIILAFFLHPVPLIMATSIPRHSERTQECFVGIREGSNMTQSEESVTLMTFYRLPHHASRSFAFVQDDVLPFSLLQQPILC